MNEWHLLVHSQLSKFNHRPAYTNIYSHSFCNAGSLHPFPAKTCIISLLTTFLPPMNRVQMNPKCQNNFRSELLPRNSVQAKNEWPLSLSEGHLPLQAICSSKNNRSTKQNCKDSKNKTQRKTDHRKKNKN